MCGIIGIAAQSSVRDRDWLAAGRDALAHRGPDDRGEWWSEDGRVGLGHRRLSILDLSEAGHQPMRDSAGDHCIAFNGEIYNFLQLRDELESHGHVFRSRTDTEVILAAYRQWGTACVERLNGMFAFALFDALRQQVLLARDRAGEKPLFYAARPGSLRFASELKGLLADPTAPRQIDADALDCYLAYGFVPGERCILQGYNKLPPAHALLYDLHSGEARSWRYWRVPDGVAGDEAAAGDESLLDELEQLLADAVRLQLVADVPVGVLLSGGVDSSLVTAMAVRSAAQVHTFTVRFPGHGTYDETEHARLIARHFGTEHVELEAGDVSPEIVTRLAAQYDEPVADSSMLPTYLLSQVVRQHCTVALGGDGGDELFGGYRQYDDLLRHQRQVRWLPLSARQAIASTAATVLPPGFKGRNWLRGLGVDLDSRLPLIPSHLSDDDRRRLLGNGSGSWRLVAEAIAAERTPRGGDLLYRATRSDFENYLPEDVLVKVDRASMLASLEIRAPLLDTRIVEFAFGRVPSRLKATTSGRKLLLKQLAHRVLPPQFDQRRKQGFSIPLVTWLRGEPWSSFFRSVLLESPQPVFERRTMESLLARGTRHRTDSERLFALVVFELWRREYGVELP